ncbi:muramoyltetrapeptide carboxypeptidase [Pedobacter westerhofensis]|uniref:Muramoyltetrapeptide carboxypeptidase n=1 Tax=Pedobacter westerhofensis TaxID=425512 RepID=A0A521DU88_9SPHI|nr:LD-carboxypeptidase [Pedobacter westerhofensis]SMO75289.1 muramoyltetrapeptide carboxypeptidase [Pedobacter westerhofensis]
MIKQPPYLKKGDKVAIVSPAKKLKQSIDYAIALLEGWGLEVILGKSVYAAHHQFAGNDAMRAEDLQTFLDDKEIKAIIAARGGYGTIRIIDALDFCTFNDQPKWVVGFSDITVLLSHITGTEQTQSIHGQMPGTFDNASPESIESLRKALFGEDLSYTYESEFPNQPGEAEGILIGGNLSLLVALEGSSSAMDFKDKILFLEDVGEYEYAIDRMLRMLKRGGKLAELKGLIVGAFNHIELEDIPFGQGVEEVIAEIVSDYNYPVCFNFPVGHIEDNRAMVLGKITLLKVEEHQVSFKQKS